MTSYPAMGSNTGDSSCPERYSSYNSSSYSNNTIRNDKSPTAHIAYAPPGCVPIVTASARMMPTYSPLEVPAFEAGLEVVTMGYSVWADMVARAKIECDENMEWASGQDYIIEDSECNNSSYCDNDDLKFCEVTNPVENMTVGDHNAEYKDGDGNVERFNVENE